MQVVHYLGPMTTTTTPAPIRLPSGHALDWFTRCAQECAYRAEIVTQTKRTVTMELDDAALADLVADALYYAEEMGPENTGGADYRPKARTALRALSKAGVTWQRARGFAVTITAR